MGNRAIALIRSASRREHFCGAKEAPPSHLLALNMHGEWSIQLLRAFSRKQGEGQIDSCMKAPRMTDKKEWVVWNGSIGILDMATIGDIRHGESGRNACLAPPYGVVGPFSLDELETAGRIAFGECLVMSRQRWRQDQLELRLEAHRKRRAFRFAPDLDDDDQEHREILDLPIEGALKPADVNAAFRQLAKTAHPDAGGSDESYRRIVAARDALLKRLTISA